MIPFDKCLYVYIICQEFFQTMEICHKLNNTWKNRQETRPYELLHDRAKGEKQARKAECMKAGVWGGEWGGVGRCILKCNRRLNEACPRRYQTVTDLKVLAKRGHCLGHTDSR